MMKLLGGKLILLTIPMTYMIPMVMGEFHDWQQWTRWRIENRCVIVDVDDKNRYGYKCIDTDVIYR